MTFIPQLYEKHCFIACSKDRVESGMCSCINRMHQIPDYIMDYIPPAKDLDYFREEAAKELYHNQGYKALEDRGDSMTLHLCRKEAEIRFLKYQLAELRERLNDETMP